MYFFSCFPTVKKGGNSCKILVFQRACVFHSKFDSISYTFSESTIFLSDFHLIFLTNFLGGMWRHKPSYQNWLNLSSLEISPLPTPEMGNKIISIVLFTWSGIKLLTIAKRSQATDDLCHNLWVPKSLFEYKNSILYVANENKKSLPGIYILSSQYQKFLGSHNWPCP